MKAFSEFEGIPTGSWGFSLAATIQLSALSGARDGIDLVGTLGSPQVSPTDGRNSGTVQFERDLERPFVVRLQRGRVIELRVPRGASLEQVGILRTLAAALQVPGDASRPTLRAHEYDATGEYEAEYRLQDRTLKKRKLNYVRLLAVGSRVKSSSIPRVIDSLGTLRFRPDGILQDASYDETIGSDLGNGAHVKVRAELDVKHVDGSAAPALARADIWEATTPVLSDHPYGEATSRATFDDLRAPWHAS